MFLLTQCASPVLTYDRLSLLNLEDVSNKLLNQARTDSFYAPPHLLMSIPYFALRVSTVEECARTIFAHYLGAKQPKESTEHLARLKMALINARSVVNKTFIINDFFSSSDLDFFFLITETWLSAGDLSPFSELLPSNCLFLSTPHSTGQSRGLTSIYKEMFSCCSVASNEYSSFELQLFTLELDDPLLIAVIYHPPKYNKNFLTEFFGRNYTEI